MQATVKQERRWHSLMRARAMHADPRRALLALGNLAQTGLVEDSNLAPSDI
jgi:hypothetical protein